MVKNKKKTEIPQCQNVVCGNGFLLTPTNPHRVTKVSLLKWTTNAPIHFSFFLFLIAITPSMQNSLTIECSTALLT